MVLCDISIGIGIPEMSIDSPEFHLKDRTIDDKKGARWKKAKTEK